MATISKKPSRAFGKPGIGVFLTRNGRLPGFAQRRLDSLIEKKGNEGLTREETRELKEMLEYVDRKTEELLRYEVGKRRNQAKREKKR